LDLSKDRQISGRKPAYLYLCPAVAWKHVSVALAQIGNNCSSACGRHKMGTVPRAKIVYG
jgi:hypothetical protein